MRRVALPFVIVSLSLALAPPVFADDPKDEEVTRSAAFMEADALVQAEAFSLAQEKLIALSEVEPNNPDVFNLLGFASRNNGDFDGAAAAYRRALALDPNHLGALEYQGELYLALNQPQEAEANLTQLATLCPAGCEEQADLAAALAAWRAENAS